MMSAHGDYNRELFAVAPMMGHTNRHYRYFFRLLSKRAFLYTEMIPSSQIIRAYRRAKAIYQNDDPFSESAIHTEDILELMHFVSSDPSREYSTVLSHERDVIPLTLHQLLSTSGSVEYPVALQLGGRNPETLGAAAAIGTAYSSSYMDVNLNCGCPSNAVGGRSGGCALMKEPETVAQCVESMHKGVASIYALKSSWLHNSTEKSQMPQITVKHRLGVRDASTFDGVSDRLKSDDEAFEECSSFIRTVSMSGVVAKFQVHARLGLLGNFNNEENSEDDEGKQRLLWVPTSESASKVNDKTNGIKFDHKRAQIQAQKRAKKATLLNRDVPPLRPNVVQRVASEFPHLKFTLNGGINEHQQVIALLEHFPNEGVLGAMVGRSAINHPCSFSHVDELWGDDTSSLPSRGEILENYIQYCNNEEIYVKSLGTSKLYLENLRKRLIAVPYHLFTGERGSDAFQRQLKKLRDKTEHITASTILSAAASFVPREILSKSIGEFVPWHEIQNYEIGLGRGSAMQRVVY